MNHNMHVNLELNKPLEDYVAYIGRLNGRTILMAESFWAPGIAFQDPYFKAVGAGDAQKIMRHRHEVCKDSRYRVKDYFWTTRPDTAHISWEFSFSFKERLLSNRKSTSSLSGISEVLFNTDGKVAAQSDFWGAQKGFPEKTYQKLEL